MRKGPVKRRAQIVNDAVLSPYPCFCHTAGSIKLGAGARRFRANAVEKHTVIVGVTASNSVGLATSDRFLRSMGAGGIQQSKMRNRFAGTRRHKGFSHEAAHRRNTLPIVKVAPCRNRTSRFKRKTPGECGQPAQNGPLKLLQQVIAPVERSCECSVAR